MKMKKRILSCLLAVSMVAGLSIPAFAADATTTEKSFPAQVEATKPTLEVDDFATLAEAVENEAVTTIIIKAGFSNANSTKLTFTRTAPLTIKGPATGDRPILDFAIQSGTRGDVNALTIQNLEFKVTDKSKLYNDGQGYCFLYFCADTIAENCIIDSTSINDEDNKVHGIISLGDSIKITGNTFKIDNTTDMYNNYGIFFFPVNPTATNISGNIFTNMTGKHIDIGVDDSDPDTGTSTGLDKIKTISSNIWSPLGLNIYANDLKNAFGASFGTSASVFRNSTAALAKFAGALNETDASVVVVDKDGQAELYTRDKKSYHVANGMSVDYLGVANDNWAEIPPIDWNTDSAAYGTVTMTGDKATLKATSNADGTLYHAPYTTFGRGNTDTTFGNGFETSITFDMTKVDASTSLYWEHDLNDTSAANKIGFSTILNQSSDKNSVTVDYSYNDDPDNNYIYKTIDGTLDSKKPITIKTKAEPSGGKIKITITASDGTKNLTASHNVKDSVYGGLRIGWVHFTAASKTVDVSAVTYRDLDAPTTPTPPATPSYGGGGGSYTPSDTTADVSANTPTGTEATIDSGVTNIANPVLDVKTTAANAPEVAEFIKAASGFAVAKVFEINMFDSTTVVKQVEGGKVEITLPFTAPDTSKQYVVLRYNDDKTVTVIPATIDGGKISFKTDHFSTYAIAVKSDNPNLFVDTTVNQPVPSSPTTVPKTGIALLGRLF